MNILKRELRTNLKVFLFWILGLFILMYSGMAKFQGLKTASSQDLNAIFEQLPRVIRAIFGMVDVDPTSLWGYFSMMIFYVTICGGIYGIHLGANAVNRESIDKTYEFIFTKPRSRTYILSYKLLAGLIYVVAFGLFQYLFCIMSFQMTGINTYDGTILALFCLQVFIISLLFFGLSAMLSVLVPFPERGALFGNLVFLGTFVLGILCDIMTKPGVFRTLAPLKYFSPNEIIQGQFNYVFLALTLTIIILSTIFTYQRFRTRDLNAN